MQPGLWQMTMKATMSGLPMAMPPQTHSTKVCLKKKDIERPWKSMQAHNHENCTFSNVKINGHRASYTMKCTGAAQSQGHGVIIVGNPTSIREIVDETTSSGGMTMKMHIEGSGHLVGDCTGTQ